MPSAEGPTVSLSFANNFWGKEDAGVGPLLERMHNAKVTSDELKSFYAARAALEDEYSRKLLALSRKPLGSHEEGSLRASLDVVRGEVESMGKAHQSIAQQMKAELDEPLSAFAGGLKERRKIVQNGIEKLLKVKTQQTQSVNKSRDRFEQDCLRIKGYLAQGHMVMGQEERKNKAKLEKTQIQMASTSNEYEASIKALEETTGRWNRDWKAACDKFQDFEEERIDFTKSSLWTFANIASTVCVSDDASCEKIRLALENCEVEKDITGFIQDHGTGQEIPDAPKYINFCRGDVNDAASETSEDEAYSVAQFQRTVNPAYRTSSPVPSTLDSHHDPSNALKKLNLQDDQSTPRANVQPLVSNGPVPNQPDFRRQAAEVQQAFNNAAGVDLAPVPHNEYPTDGMTMFCRSDVQSDLSAASSGRPVSRDNSEYSNPTSFSSIEPTSGNVSPVKQFGSESQSGSPTKGLLKKRSGFFSNSPFRRRSKHEKDRSDPKPSITTTNTMNNRGQSQSPIKPGISARDFASQPDDLEPVDPRANFQLNVGNNVFDVASPDSQPRNKPTSLSSRHLVGTSEEDPLVAALAELKGVSKQPAARVSADRYAGVATPAPGTRTQNNATQQREAPPGYHDPGVVTRLDAPKPAHTSASMQATTRQYANQNANMYGSDSRPGSSNINRAPSPNPIRSASPRPGMHQDTYRSASPNPYGGQRQQQRPQQAGYGQQTGYGQQSRQASPADVRAPSPQPGYMQPHRPGSAQAIVLSNGDGGSRNGRGQVGRPMSYYGGGTQGGQGQHRNDSRTRSKSAAAVRPLYYARALYNYTAAIPEELSFQKHDTLAILRLQDDGWWEAEVPNGRGGAGLVPSNYLQRC